MKKYNIAIAGCGISGMVSALLLKRLGHEITIFDQMEKPRPVGSGLVIQPVGLAVLGYLGLADDIYNLSSRIDRIFGLTSPCEKLVLDLRYDKLGKNRYGLGIHRASLFDVLYKAICKANISHEFAHEIHSQNDGQLIFKNGLKSAKFDVIINGLGANSPLSKKGRILPYGALWASLDWEEETNFKDNALEQRYKTAKKMMGILPIGHLPDSPIKKAAFFWSIRHEDYAKWQDDGLEKWKDEALEIWQETSPFLEQITNKEQLTLAYYTHRSLKNPYGDKIIHIGDSYHAASPQLGQGANMSLLDAFALYKAFVSNNGSFDNIAKNFKALRHYHIGFYQLCSWLFTPVYQSDSRILPFIRDIIVPPLTKIPPAPQIMSAMVAGVLGNPLKKLGLEEAKPHSSSVQKQ